MPTGARRLALEGALSQLLQTTTVIAFDERCAREAARLRVVLEAKGALIGNLDIQIAGLALANDGFAYSSFQATPAISIGTVYRVLRPRLAGEHA